MAVERLNDKGNRMNVDGRTRSDPPNQKSQLTQEQASSMCRMCSQRPETTICILSECEKPSQGEYKDRHEQVALTAYCGLCERDLSELTTGMIAMRNHFMILWDFTTCTVGARYTLAGATSSKPQEKDHHTALWGLHTYQERSI